MARSQGEWVQCELKRGKGSEPWVIVRHRRGWFRVPGDATVSEVMRGVAEGWTASNTSVMRKGPVTVTPLDEGLERVHYLRTTEPRR